MSLEIEKRTLAKMFRIYCSSLHKPNGELCNACEALLGYSLKKLEHCRFGEDKPTCKYCPVHCYNPAKREEVKAVMRFAGPRMIYLSPLLAIRHMVHNRSSEKHRAACI